MRAGSHLLELEFTCFQDSLNSPTLNLGDQARESRRRDEHARERDQSDQSGCTPTIAGAFLRWQWRSISQFDDHLSPPI